MRFGWQVAIDGQVKAELDTKPPVPNKGPLYSGPKFYPAADAELADLRLYRRPIDINKCQTLFRQKKYQRLVKK